MSREHNGLAGLALAPWEEPCTEAADTAADDRAALMALEDAGAVADVPTWLAREQATAGDVVGAAEGRRQRARADYDADLARLATNVAEAEATLTAKRGAR